MRPISPRREHGVELLVFLLLVIPPLALSLVVKMHKLPFRVVAIATSLQDIALVALVLFFLWRNGEPRSAIGWSLRRVGREIALGLLMFPVAAVLASFVVAALHVAGVPAPEHTPRALVPHGRLDSILGVGVVAIVAIAEETIFRGYLIGRLRELTRSAAAAVVLSTAIFTLGHGYEGASGMVGVAVLGLLFALVYLWRRSLVAPMTMHFCQDLFALVIMPHFVHAAR